MTFKVWQTLILFFFYAFVADVISVPECLLIRLTGEAGFGACFCRWPWGKILRMSLRALGTLRTVSLVWWGILTDPTVAGSRGPQRRARYRIASSQESVDEVAVFLVGRLQHLLGGNIGVRVHWGLECPRMMTRNVFHSLFSLEASTFSRTFPTEIGQVWWLPWFPAPPYWRLPSFGSNSHSSFSTLSFWSNSQSSSSAPSHPWNDISRHA